MGRASAGVRVAATAVAGGLALATRLPGDLAWSAVAVASALALCVGAVAGVRLARARWPRAAVILGALALLVVPRPAGAVLAAPAALVALAVLAALHLNLPSADAAPARVGSSRVRQAIVRGAPVAALLALVAVLPWLARSALPDRLAKVEEWDGALGPLAAGALVVLVLVATAAVHAIAARRTVELEEEPVGLEGPA